MRALLAFLLIVLLLTILTIASTPYRHELVVSSAQNSVVRLSMQGPSGEGACTGEVIASNRVLTALPVEVVVVNILP